MFSRNLMILFACLLSAVGNAAVCDEPIHIGSWTEITSFSINGNCVNEFEVERGQEVKVHLEYYNPEKGCTGCLEQVYVGIQGQKLDCIYNGNPWTHFEDDHVITIPTDAEPGTYVIVAKGTYDWTCSHRTDGIPIATIRVVERPASGIYQYHWPTERQREWYKCNDCGWLPSSGNGVVESPPANDLGLTKEEACFWWCDQEPECMVAWHRKSGDHCSLYDFELDHVQQTFESDSHVYVKPIGTPEEHDQYIGCFKDDGKRDLDVAMDRASSVNECNMKCSEYDFFALQAFAGKSAHCFCGNEYGSSDAYYQVDDSVCAKRTGGNMNGARSGGAWRNAVYFVKNFNFQLKGLDGTEIVVITDGQETRQRFLSSGWQTFGASNANINIRFTNDGRNRDVFFRSNTYTDIRSDHKFAQWKCDTSSPQNSLACERIRSGFFHWTTDYQIEFKNAAHWKTCRWQSTKERFVDDRKHLVGWTCADDEILTGFGIKAGEDDVSRIQCCKLGGHSSVIPETCTLLEAGMNGFDQHELASCNANDHMVFSGAYDASTLADDGFTEILVGKCCEVKCDAPWCRNKDWGVNTDPDHCHTIVAGGDKTKAQDLVCPEGTLVTEIRDGHDKEAYGIQRVESVVCCEMDLVSQPTIAPSRAPSTTKPSPSPTTAPSPSPTNPPTPSPTNPPSTSPTTAPSPSPTTAPSVAPTTTTDCLLSLFRGLPHLSDAEILQGMDDCLPNCVVPQLYERRALEGRLLSENSE